MSEDNDFSEPIQYFLESLRAAAGPFVPAKKLVAWLEERAVEVPLLEMLPPSPHAMTREIFEERRDKINAHFEKVGMPEMRLPDTWEEFEQNELEMLKYAHAAGQHLPTFHMPIPEDWDLDQVALVPIDAKAKPHYIPGHHVVGYAPQYLWEVQGDGEARLHCHAIAVGTERIPKMWFGLAAMRHVMIARLSMASNPEGLIDNEDVRNAINQIFRGQPSRAEKRLWLNVYTDYNMRPLLQGITGGLLEPMMQAFKINPHVRSVDDIEFHYKRAAECGRFLLHKLDKAESEPEEHIRADLIGRIVLAHALPPTVIVEIMKRQTNNVPLEPYFMG